MVWYNPLELTYGDILPKQFKEAWDVLFLFRYHKHEVSLQHAPWNSWGGYMPDLAVKVIRILLLAFNFMWTVERIMSVPFEQ